MTTVNTKNNKQKFSVGLLSILTIWVLTFSLLIIGCTTTNEVNKKNTVDLEVHWGVKPEAIRLTAAGHMIDFRYRVIDPEKAMGLMKRGDKAFIIDKASGIKLPVPVTKVGPMRGTGTKPKADKVYAVMFANSGGVIQRGSEVTVVIGKFRAEGLIVE